jgi:hypothetical protein
MQLIKIYDQCSDNDDNDLLKDDDKLPSDEEWLESSPDEEAKQFTM